MLLFFLISTILVTLTRSDETNSSRITNYISEKDDTLKSYEAAKISLLRSLSEFKCIDNISSCSNHGVCNEDKSDCICDSGHISYPIDNIEKCNYTQKKQLVAFLCELFLGFWAGHFYSERYQTAGLKLAAFLFGIYIICLFPISAKCISDRCDSDYLVIAVSCFYYCCAVGLAFWFIYDLVMFGMNNYNDGNGITLLPWGVQSNP